MFTSLSAHTTLPKTAHEVAILVTGARFHSQCALYAHERVAADVGLSAAKIATIAAGSRPADLTAEEGVAYEVALVLSGGGQLGDAAYEAAVNTFGDAGTAELFYLIGSYLRIFVLLNGCDVPAPE